MYLRNRENISLTKKKKLQRKQKGGVRLTIKQRLALLKNSMSPSHIFKFKNRSNKVEQEPSQPKEKRTRTRAKKIAAIAAETTDAAKIAKIVEIARTQTQQIRDNEIQNTRLATAMNRAFETESAKIAQETQELSNGLARAMFGENAILTNSPVTPLNTLSQEEEALLQELEELKKGGKKSRTHRKPKRARK